MIKAGYTSGERHGPTMRQQRSKPRPPTQSQLRASVAETLLGPERLSAYRFRMTVDRTAWQALHTLNYYRLFVTGLFVLLFFTPLLQESMEPAALESCRIVTGVFLLMAPVLFLIGRQIQRRPGLQALVGLGLDLWGVLIATHGVGGVSSGIGTLLVGDMLLAGVIYPPRLSLLYAAAGTIAVLWQSLAGVFRGTEPPSVLAPSGMLGAAYFAITLLGLYLATRTRESQAVARQRSADVASLAQLNEMIIQRMRTGVALIDENDNIHLMNESAWYLTGMRDHRSGRISDLAPDLAEDVSYWRKHGKQNEKPRQLGTGVPRVVPRFARLGTGDETDLLVFLEDTSVISRRAEELTLASLGRLSASIAHEIRNPLAAISHSAQLLSESREIHGPDEKLTEIILRHCNRMNDIIENVLHLARQQAARPEVINLGDWLANFVEEFRRHHDLRGGDLLLAGEDREAEALMDPVHLQQVLWNLCQNGLKYGRGAGDAPKVSLAWGRGSPDQPPWIEVRDGGPGIPEADRERIFEPFFSSSREGTGLGLYLSRQLVESNQGSITYRFDEAGSCFRIELARQREIMRPVNAEHAAPEAAESRPDRSAPAAERETER
ncbi:MAG: HAMP domain-containing sensor histidine kinase [Xanthomonadales bacterium]|nr:HAMP domain-containing sensor histidine kinase [Xanthomonadales bacterium]